MGNQTTIYSLRLWIDSSVEDNIVILEFNITSELNDSVFDRIPTNSLITVKGEATKALIQVQNSNLRMLL